MKNIVLFILSIFVIFGILNLGNLISDWIAINISPIIIYLGIVGLFASTVYYFFKKEME